LLLEGFGWGGSFWEVNLWVLPVMLAFHHSNCHRPFLDRYKACQSSVDVEREQGKIMEELEKDYQEARTKGDFHRFIYILPCWRTFR
jgi:pre-rRNA-processing protein TSR3